MIKYRLICNDSHEFEGWFRNGAQFDEQCAGGQVVCPTCGSNVVGKAVMAPNLAPGRRDRSVPDAERQREIVSALRRLREEVEARATYVGDRFAEEARKIHFGEAEPRHVYGEASRDEVHDLVDDGVPVLPLPRPPKDLN